MSDRPNPYETLGVAKDADAKQIRKAFLVAAKKYHPDQYDKSAMSADEAKDKMQTLTVAYETLKNDETRAKFDRGGWDAVDGNEGTRSASSMDIGDMASSFPGGNNGARSGITDDEIGRRRRGSGKGRVRPKLRK